MTRVQVCQGALTFAQAKLQRATALQLDERNEGAISGNLDGTRSTLRVWDDVSTILSEVWGSAECCSVAPWRQLRDSCWGLCGDSSRCTTSQAVPTELSSCTPRVPSQGQYLAAHWVRRSIYVRVGG